MGGAEGREVGSWGCLLPAGEAPTLYTRVHGRRGDLVGWGLQLLLWRAGLDSHWPMSLAVRTTSLSVGNPISSPPSSYTTCPLCPPVWPPSTFHSFSGHLFPLSLPVLAHPYSPTVCSLLNGGAALSLAQDHARIQHPKASPSPDVGGWGFLCPQ